MHISPFFLPELIVYTYVWQFLLGYGRKTCDRANTLCLYSAYIDCTRS